MKEPQSAAEEEGARSSVAAAVPGPAIGYKADITEVDYGGYSCFSSSDGEPFCTWTIR